MKAWLLLSAVALLGSMGALRAEVPPLFSYELQGNLTDTTGAGADLVPDVAAGTFVAGGGYDFEVGTGLALNAPASAGTFDGGNYSIVLHCRLDFDSGYRRLIDFKNLTTDDGVYYENGVLVFYPVATGTGVVPAGSFATVALTRDGSTGEVKVYLNGSLELSFEDTGGIAVADAVLGSSVFHFFKDDAAFGGEESSGRVRQIQIFDRPLTPAEVVAVSVPALTVSAGPVAGEATLRWPVQSGVGFQLERNDNLLDAWTPDPGTPSLVGSNYELVTPLDTPRRFFRLRR
ncbi:MAG: hypothetical protein JSR82_20980 [Verrucomicrobia bacterium]|nr:hypothetical protein [Verrucomicrobiota bacterium]